MADYERNLDRVLIDAAAEPALRRFIDASEYETITVDLGDGRQAQVQALKRSAVHDVVERIVSEAAQVGVDLKNWICSPEEGEFDLCSKLDTRVGERMRQLNAFLNRKWLEGGLHAVGLVTLFTAPALGTVLTIFSALGFVNGVFVELCECPERP